MPVSPNAAPPLILGPDQQVPGAPVELYRQTIPFVLQTAGIAEEIEVDAASALAGQFLAHVFDVRPLSSTGLQAQGDKTVLVTLLAPRRIRKVKTSAGAQIGLHRVDVDKVVEEATVTLANNSAVTPTFADARFALRRSDGGNLSPAQVDLLEVTSFPSSPRLGVTLSGITPAPEPVYFWQGSGEIGQGGEPADGQIAGGAALADALARLLNRHLAALRDAGQPIPAQVGAALLVESSAPCRFQLQTLTLVYRVVTASWLGLAGAAAQEKQVLRFSDQHLDSATLSVALPAAASLQSAALRAVISRAAPPSTAGQANGTGDIFPPPAQTAGFYVDHRAVALAVTPPAALTASGVAVAVLPLSPDLALQLALHADAAGAPAGVELATVTVGGEPAGQARWVTAQLPARLPLSRQRVWLVLRAQTGACIWLATGDTTPEDVAISRQDEARGLWLSQPRGVLPGLAYRLLSPALAGPPDLSTPAAQPSLSVSLAGTPLVAGIEGDTHTFDLMPALAAYLQSGPAPDLAGLVYAPLAFRAFGLRQATVYPPRLAFSL